MSAAEKSRRILSIDIFRGLTIFTMVFVNDLAGVRNIPQWMKHMPSEADGMTFVDLVFPAFLFIVGMAIPFAIGNRMGKGDSVWDIWKHILIRTAGLLMIGVFMVNIGSLDSAATGLEKHLWTFLMFVGVLLVWNQYPPAEGPRARIYKVLKYVGIVLLIVLAAIYRREDAGQIEWMQTSWWGILGLIGWSYLFSCAVYFFCKDNQIAMVGMIAFFIALYIGDKTGKLDFIPFIGDYLWLGGHIGGHASITTAGMMVALLFVKNSHLQEPRERIRRIIVFAVFLFATGYLLRGLYGISKNLATPSWSLYSSGICCLLFAFLYWLVDVRGFSKWAAFARPAGTNPLLAYILPSMIYALLAIFNIKFYSTVLGHDGIGILRSVVFAFLILGITQLMTGWKVRLHL